VRLYAKLRPSFAETGSMGPEGRVPEGLLGVSEMVFSEGWRWTDGVWRK